MRRMALAATAVVVGLSSLSATTAAAGKGVYVGVEGGANLARDQTLRQSGSQIGDLGFDTGYFGALALGGTLAGGLRPELELGYRRNDLKELDPPLGAAVAAQGQLEAYTAMANLWLEIRQPRGPFSFIHPYLGAGVGGARVGWREPSFGGVPQNESARTLFAYQGGAGVGFDLTPSATLSLDYRFLQTNIGRFDLAPGNRTALRYSAHTPMASLRISFGGTPAPTAPPAKRAVVATRILPAPPSDRDGDGVPDDIDTCPDTPAGFKVDIKGCIVEQTVILQAVNFDYDSDRLTKDSRATLDRVAGALRAQPELKVEIGGYTDSVGVAAYNLKLSQRRAEAVRKYLSAAGVPQSSMTAKGHGKASPIGDNATEEGRAQNRRVEFVVTSKLSSTKAVSDKRPKR